MSTHQSEGSRIIVLRFIKDDRMWEKAIEVQSNYVFTPMSVAFEPVSAPGRTITRLWQSIVGIHETYWFDPVSLVEVTSENLGVTAFPNYAPNHLGGIPGSINTIIKGNATSRCP